MVTRAVCSRRHCTLPAAWVPVVLLRVHPFHEPLRMHLEGVIVCDVHRIADADAFVSDWPRLCLELEAVGLVAPVRELTQVDFRPIH